jgi:hypothetical protein
MRMIGSLVAAAALLMAVAGVAKLRAPEPAAAMLSQAWPVLGRVGVLPRLIRASGVVEAGIGGAVLVHGGRPAAVLLTACYAGFVVVALRLTLRGQHTSCGCFGRTESPVGVPHIALNVVGLGAGVAASIRPTGPLGGLFEAGPVLGVVGVAQVVLLAWLGFLAITALPELTALRRRTSEVR